MYKCTRCKQIYCENQLPPFELIESNDKSKKNLRRICTCGYEIEKIELKLKPDGTFEEDYGE